MIEIHKTIGYRRVHSRSNSAVTLQPWVRDGRAGGALRDSLVDMQAQRLVLPAALGMTMDLYWLSFFVALRCCVWVIALYHI